MDLKGLESDIVNSIIESTTEVCSTMLMMDVKVDDTFIKDERNVYTDLISSLHFFSNRYMGKIAIFSSGSTTCLLAGAMLGMEVNEVDEDVKDCMGEIANMIAGTAKTKLEESMGFLHLLTPWVISGKKLTISSSAKNDEELSIDSQAQFSWIITRFVFDKGEFTVGVQPNDVPEDESYHAQLENKVLSLEKENKNLRKEIASLKT